MVISSIGNMRLNDYVYPPPSSSLSLPLPCGLLDRQGVPGAHAPVPGGRPPTADHCQDHRRRLPGALQDAGGQPVREEHRPPLQRHHRQRRCHLGNSS